jgi:hypothetical protein
MPSVAWTYTSLFAALQAWPQNTNPTYLANLPSIIGMGEIRLIKDLDLEIFDTTDEAILFTIGSRLVLKPTNAIRVRSVGYLDPTLGYQALKVRSMDYLRAFAPLTTVQATPQYYAEYSPTQIYVADTPNAALSLSFHSVTRPTDLLDSITPAATSWLSVRCPEALLTACLMEADHYMQSDDRYDDLQKKYYDVQLPAARFELRQLQRNGDYSPFEPAARSK